MKRESYLASILHHGLRRVTSDTPQMANKEDSLLSSLWIPLLEAHFSPIRTKCSIA